MKARFVVQTRRTTADGTNRWFDMSQGSFLEPFKAIRLFRGLRHVPRKERRIIIRQETVVRKLSCFYGDNVVMVAHPRVVNSKTKALKEV